MSFNYDTYVGPYARCAIERVPVTKLQITCPAEGCKNHGKGMRQSYCDLCGAKVVTLPHIEIEDAIDQWDVREAIEDALCNPGGDGYMNWTVANSAHLWKPNQRMPGRDPHLEEREDFALFEIVVGQREAEIVQFRSTFADALDELRSRYGNLTLHWGIIQDCS